MKTHRSRPVLFCEVGCLAFYFFREPISRCSKLMICVGHALWRALSALENANYTNLGFGWHFHQPSSVRHLLIASFSHSGAFASNSFCSLSDSGVWCLFASSALRNCSARGGTSHSARSSSLVCGSTSHKPSCFPSKM